MYTKNTIVGTALFRTFVILLLFFILLHGIPANSITTKINNGSSDNTSTEGERTRFTQKEFAESIENGLEFLNRTQLDNGGWLEGNNGASCHVTGICLRALLNYKGIQEPYKDTIHNGIEFLKDSWHDPSDYPAGQQRDNYGGLVINDRHFPEENNSIIMRSHGAATRALLDYYFHSQDLSIIPYINASVDMIIRAQNTPRKPNTMGGPRNQGGWGPRPNSTHSVTSLSGWNLSPMVLAESSGVYDVPDDAFEYAEKWLLSSYNGNLFGENSSAPVGSDITAIATYCLYTLGKGETPAAQNGINYINNQILQWNTVPDPIGSNGNCPYLWYYFSTYSMYLVGGDKWDSWRSQMSSLLLENQNDNGSWSPLKNETDLGFNYATAMALMCLELFSEQIELSLIPRKDPPCECPPNLALVEPEETVIYNFEVRARPISIEAHERDIRVNLTISEPLEGWSAELYTPNTPDDGIVLPNGARMWWVTVYPGALMEPPLIHLNVTAAKIGPSAEPCVITITATIEDDYRFIQASMNTISILDIDFDFTLDFIADTDNFGNKIVNVETGFIKTFQLSIRNLGNVNDSYELSLFSEPSYIMSFPNGGLTYDLNLSKNGTEKDETVIDIEFETPIEAKTNEIINLTVIGTSKIYASMGLGTYKRSDQITLLVTESPILLSCHDSLKYVDPGEKEVYEIQLFNNVESTLDVLFSFYGNRTMIEAAPGFAINWTGRFPVNNFDVRGGETLEVVFELFVPKYAISGDRINIRIASSGYDESGIKYESPPLFVSAIVNRIVNVTAEIEPLNHSCYPGGTVNYTLNIINEGNSAVVVKIKEYELPDGWKLDLSNYSVPLDPFQDTFVDMMVTIPGNAIYGLDTNLTEGRSFRIGLLVTSTEVTQGKGTLLYVDLTVIPPDPIMDITPPRIKDVSHEILQSSDALMVDIKVRVIDDGDVGEVWLTIISPDGEITNVSLTRSQIGEIYSYNEKFSMSGDYEYFFWVRDKEKNQNISNIYTFNLKEPEKEGKVEDNDEDDNSTKDKDNPFMSKYTIRWMMIGLLLVIVLSSIILVINKKKLIFPLKRKDRNNLDKEIIGDDGDEDEFGRVEGNYLNHGNDTD